MNDSILWISLSIASAIWFVIGICVGVDWSGHSMKAPPRRLPFEYNVQDEADMILDDLERRKG